jgi:porin
MSFTQPMTALRTVPQTALGGGVVWLPEKNTMVTALALDSEGQTNTSGFDTIWHDGTTLLVQAQHENLTGDLPGGQRLGATWSNKEYTSVDQDPRLAFLGAAFLGRPAKTGTDSWSVFADVWQFVENWDGTKDKGWGVFARAGWGDPETNPIDAAYTLGVGGQGGLFCRKDDGLSNKLDVRHITSEKGLEAYYSIGVTPWMHLTPSVQLIDPFIREFTTTLIGGIRLQIDF